MKAPKPKWTASARALAFTLGAAVVTASAVAAAQTIVSAPTSDPLVEGLRDQVNSLETQVRNLTGEKEMLQFQLRQARDENTRLQRTVEDMQQQANSATQASAVGTLSNSLPPAPGAPSPAGDTLPAGGDPAAAYTQAYAFITRGSYADAQTAFAAFLATYPTDTRAPSARYWLGQAMLQQGANSDAASQFLTIVKQSPRADIAPDALVRLGVALNRMGQKPEACATLASLAGTFPRANATTKASAAAQAKAIGC